MSFLSSIVIGIVEKELAAHTPEMEQLLVNLISAAAKDLVAHLERKIGLSASEEEEEAQNE